MGSLYGQPKVHEQYLSTQTLPVVGILLPHIPTFSRGLYLLYIYTKYVVNKRVEFIK